MVGGPMKMAVNQFIMDNPTVALHVAEGLVAVGAGLTLRHVMKAIGVKESALPEGGMAEVELLDEKKPGWLVPRTVTSLRAGLLAYKMRNDIAVPQMDWKHGVWDVQHKLGGFDVPSTQEAVGFDVTVVHTPVMNAEGRLV